MRLAGSQVRAYVAATVAVSVALLIRRPLWPVLGGAAPYLTVLPAVLAAAYAGGYRAGLFATLLGGVGASYLLHDPTGPGWLSTAADIGGLILFGLVGGAVSGLTETAQRAKRRAAVSAGREREGEERLRVTLASIGDAVAVTDTGGAVTFLNPAAEALTGWPAADALRRPLGDVFHIVREGDGAPAEDPVARVLASGRACDPAAHMILVARDGTRRPIDDSASPIRDAAGQILGVVLVFRDVTERRAHDREREEYARLAAFGRDVGLALTRADSLPAMLGRCTEAMVAHLGAAFARVWTLPPGGNVLELQASAGLYTHVDGPHARVPVGQFKIGLIAAERAPHLTNSVPDDPRVSDREWARREGMVAFAGYPLVVDDRVVGVMALFARRPLSPAALTALASVADGVAVGIERRRAEAALIRSKAELEDRVRERTAELGAVNTQLRQSNGELEQFAYVASHDLQEPLRKIRAFGDRLGDKCRDQLSGAGRDYLDRMLASAGRMSRLINDLLAYSRVATHARPPEAVDLNAVARDVVADLEAQTERTGGRVEVGPLPTVEADPTHARQLLQNLVGNALKFHKPGAAPAVNVSGRRVAVEGRPMCELSVADDGIGFDEKYLDRIFAVFQRLHGRDEYDGTGVGLAICKKIVERHGGTITARSKPGQGTTFLVTLPVPGG